MSGLANFLRALGPARILAMGVVAIGLIGFFAFLSMRLTTPQMAVLYSNVELTDAREITEKLRAMQIPFQLVDNGKTILAPEPRILEMRMEFAGQGLGGGVGYELLDRESALGTTSLMQNINHRRALEGELARTIKTINLIQDARVHLVLPERELFSRNERQPSAAVSIRTKGGKLSMTQIQSIQQLIAASAPGLDPSRVSIVDQTGALLARVEETGEGAALGHLQERQITIESRMRGEIESLVERVVGLGRVRAEVAAELDFEKVSEVAEIFDPEGQVLASSSTTDRSESDTERRSGGGATVANNLPDAQTANTPQSQSTSGENQEILNYENSRTKTTRTKESGAVKRLTVAVLVDGSYSATEDGNPIYTPRPEAELDQIRRLVENAIGYDEGRGDRVEVTNLRFAEVAGLDEEAPVENSLFNIDFSGMQRIAEVVVLGIVTILVLLLVVRPILKRVLDSMPDPSQVASHYGQLPGGENHPRLAPPRPDQIAAELAARAVGGDDEALEQLNLIRSDPQSMGRALSIEAEIDVAQVEGKLKASAVKKVGEIVQRHPDEATSIVRQWLYST